MDQFDVVYKDVNGNVVVREFTHGGECNQYYREAKINGISAIMHRNDVIIASYCANS